MTLVSKDINLRIKAAIIGVHAEDYYSDKTIEDADLLYTGIEELPANFWDKLGQGMQSWQEQARTFYRVKGPMTATGRPTSSCTSRASTGFEAIVRRCRGRLGGARARARLPARAPQHLGHRRRATASRTSRSTC